jgi:hypothetical protein
MMIVAVAVEEGDIELYYSYSWIVWVNDSCFDNFLVVF